MPFRFSLFLFAPWPDRKDADRAVADVEVVHRPKTHVVGIPPALGERPLHPTTSDQLSPPSDTGAAAWHLGARDGAGPRGGDRGATVGFEGVPPQSRG